MFEKAVLLGAPRTGGLTAGQIAEALLFYRSVHLVLDTGAVLALHQVLGADGFVRLLKREGVTATFVEGTPATVSNDVGGLKAHAFAFISHVPKDLPKGLTKGRKQDKLASLAQRLMERGIPSTDIKKMVSAVADLAVNKNLAQGAFGRGLDRLALADLQDESFYRQAIRQVLCRLVPDDLVPKAFDVRVIDTDIGFYLFGNLRIHEIEAERVRRGLPGEPITEAFVVGEFLQARVDMTVGAHYGGDFYSSPEVSSLIKLRCESLLVRAGLHKAEIAAFEDIVLESYPCVAEVIDAGERSFDDFLSVLDKAGAFRKWAHSVSPDRQLVSAYLEEVRRQPWLSTSKGKTLRYVLGQASGFESLLNAAVSALETFGVDSIAERWRASHFVESRLKPFLDS